MGVSIDTGPQSQRLGVQHQIVLRAQGVIPAGWIHRDAGGEYQAGGVVKDVIAPIVRVTQCDLEIGLEVAHVLSRLWGEEQGRRFAGGEFHHSQQRPDVLGQGLAQLSDLVRIGDDDECALLAIDRRGCHAGDVDQAPDYRLFDRSIFEFATASLCQQ